MCGFLTVAVILALAVGVSVVLSACAATDGADADTTTPLPPAASALSAPVEAPSPVAGSETAVPAPPPVVDSVVDGAPGSQPRAGESVGDGGAGAGSEEFADGAESSPDGSEEFVSDAAPGAAGVGSSSEEPIVDSRVPVDGSGEPVDDFPEVPLVELGVWVESVLESPDFAGLFAFSASGGSVYSVDFEFYGEFSDEYRRRVRGFADIEGFAYFVDDGLLFPARDGYAFDADGAQYVFFVDEFGFGSPIRYRFRLLEHERIDYGDDPASATRFGAPGVVFGAAGAQDDDWFVFDAVTGGTYAIRARPLADGEFAVAVFDAQGEVPALPVRAAYELFGAALWVAPSEGGYWIRVSQKWARPFAYKLTVDFVETPADDHGDSAADATAVAFDPGATPEWVAEFERFFNSLREEPQGEAIASAQVQAAMTLTLGEPLDEDWFSLELDKGHRYQIATLAGDPTWQTGWELDTSPDVVVTVHHDGDEIARRDYQWDPPLYLVPPVTGTYRMAVAGTRTVRSLDPAPYAILLTLFDPDDAPDLREGAVAVLPGVATEGSFDGRGDIDWFAVDAAEAQTWIVTFADRLLGCIEVHGPAGGEPLLEGCGRDYYVWTAPTSGAYGVRLFAEGDWFDTTHDPYRLTMSPAAPDDHPNHTSGATLLSEGTRLSGTIDYAGDADLFRLPVSEGEVWTIDFSGSDSNIGRSFSFWNNEDHYSDTSRHVPCDRQRCVLAAPSNGTWTIRFSGFEPLNEFALLAERLDVPDDFGSDRTHAHDLDVAPFADPTCDSETQGDRCSDTTTVEGTIEYRFDGDYFRVSLTEGTKYEIGVHSASEQVILALLDDTMCLDSTRGAQEQTGDLWIPDATADYWIRVGESGYQPGDLDDHVPERYTLEITAHPDGYEYPTGEGTATEVAPNTVHTVAESSGRDHYRVNLDHPNYVIEVNGEDFQVRGAAGEFAGEGSRDLVRLGPNPPMVLAFEVAGPEATPYTVAVRDHQPSDDELDWQHPPTSGAPEAPPAYCRPLDR